MRKIKNYELALCSLPQWAIRDTKGWLVRIDLRCHDSVQGSVFGKHVRTQQFQESIRNDRRVEGWEEK